MPLIKHGPTVVEYAEQRIREIDKLIAELQAERQCCRGRLHLYRNSTTLESERRATEAETHQRHQIQEQRT